MIELLILYTFFVLISYSFITKRKVFIIKIYHKNGLIFDNIIFVYNFNLFNLSKIYFDATNPRLTSYKKIISFTKLKQQFTKWRTFLKSSKNSTLVKVVVFLKFIKKHFIIDLKHKK